MLFRSRVVKLGYREKAGRSQDALIYKDCILKLLKTHFGGGSGSEDYTLFCPGSLPISWVFAFLQLLASKWKSGSGHLTMTDMRPAVE